MPAYKVERTEKGLEVLMGEAVARRTRSKSSAAVAKAEAPVAGVATTLSSDDSAALRELEEALWRVETRCDRAWMDEVLAEDFLELGRSGRVYNREQILNFSLDQIAAVLPRPDFEARALSGDVALLTYNSAVTIEGEVAHARRCSVWSRVADGWKLRFHQGTPYDG